MIFAGKLSSTSAQVLWSG